MERRHNLGRGTLVVLDVIHEAGATSYEQRRAMLEAILGIDAVLGFGSACQSPRLGGANSSRPP